ncbi:MAG: UbiD family decarboxylase [Pirellulales bacterium]|nr:UbiD family decarboxylase [Pirellulales bacterium]
MAYRSLKECMDDLSQADQLVRIDEPIDATLEAAAIQRRVHAAGGPAILFTNIRGCRFPMVSNLFGTLQRVEFLFRDTLESVQRLLKLKINPWDALRHPWHYWGAGMAALAMRPKVVSSGPVLARQTSIRQLPHLVSWPNDGGAFITLPIVYTEDISQPGWKRSNLGMYRIQLSGGRYKPDHEIGLHYQLHRSIGVHHAAAIREGQPLRVNIFVGGPPAMTLAAIMPLPERMSELTFAAALGGRRIRMISCEDHLPIHADADFCITGTVVPDQLLPEGPFGDHLGYYSLAHDMPVLQVDRVYHREDAIWPFTVVGRPPQEDSVFGEFIQQLIGPIIPAVLPGVHAVHAVDAAGVHPLLLAIGSERYTPYTELARPQELLTQANALLGQGQLSLAKYLFIVNRADDPDLNIQDVAAFLRHLLRRADWTRDLHFQTQTTIDTLDYTGGSLHEGSKLVIAAVGPPRFKLATELPRNLQLPDALRNPRIALPGVLVVEWVEGGDTEKNLKIDQWSHKIPATTWNQDKEHGDIPCIRWIVLVDDAEFTARTLDNFLWITFTRSNPASDVHGIDAFTHEKHWGCRGPLIIDARWKPHHAPPLVEDPQITRRVESLAARGGPLEKIL